METCASELTAEEKEARRRYNAVVSVVELESIHLVRVEASLGREEGGAIVVDEPLVLVIHPVHSQASVFAGDGRWCSISCGLKFAVSQRREGSTEADDAMTIAAEYAVFYRLPAPVQCDDDTAQRFAARNAAMNAWPFFRELALALACRMGLPDFVVPLLRVPDQIPTRERR